MNTGGRGTWFVALMCVIGCSVAGAGELNLWVSYYYAGAANRAMGEYADADVLLTAARREHRRRPEEAHRLVSTLNAQGMARMALEDYPSAKKYLDCARQTAERDLGRKSRWLPQTLNNLADLYYLAGASDKAERHYRRALALNERDQTNIEVCRSLNGLALLENDSGHTVEAEELLKRAVAVHDRHMRRAHPYCATACTNLGILYTRLGRYDEAEAALTRAEFIHNVSLGANHPDVAVRLSAQAALFAKTGRAEEAGELEARADSIRAHFAELNRSAE